MSKKTRLFFRWAALASIVMAVCALLYMMYWIATQAPGEVRFCVTLLSFGVLGYYAVGADAGRDE